MKHFFRLAALAGLALATHTAPADAHGAFGPFYDGCNKCCSGCPRPWNAFSVPCCGDLGGYPGAQPCLPYQGPGDPRTGRRGLHGYLHGYGCGMPGVGCGMGQGLCGKVKGLFHKGCKDCDGGAVGGQGGCASGACAAPVAHPAPVTVPAKLPTGVQPTSYQMSEPVYYVPVVQHPGYAPYWGYGYPTQGYYAAWPMGY